MRALDRLLALVLGLALAVAAVIAVVEISLLLAGTGSWLIDRTSWDDELSALRWDDSSVTVGLGVALGVALLVLVLQLIPRRPARLAVRETRDDRDVSISRKGLQVRLRNTAEADPDVVRSTATVTRRRAHIDAHLPAQAPRKEVRQRLGDSLRSDLDGLGLGRTPRVRLQLHQAKARVR